MNILLYLFKFEAELYTKVCINEISISERKLAKIIMIMIPAQFFKCKKIFIQQNGSIYLSTSQQTPKNHFKIELIFAVHY